MTPPDDVVVCSWGAAPGGLPGETEEVLTLGRRLSAALGGDLIWLVLGPMPDGSVDAAGKFGVAAIDRIEDGKLEEFRPDAFVEALTRYSADHPAKVLLLGQTHDARLLAPRLAGRLGSAVVMNGVDIEVDQEGRLLVTASAYGGDTRAVYALAGAGPYVVAVMPNATMPEPLEPAEASTPPTRDVTVDLSGLEERIRVVEPARTEGPRLEDAQVIVGGGRGLGAEENFRLVEELAEALGGMAGASRPIVDDGWTDSSRQLGLTGKIARPGLYIAAGISGASQHMAGCSAAKTIVAINTDPDAAIFRYARYGIVADCLQILPELIRAVKER